MMPETTTTATATVEVCLHAETVRKTNADYQRGFRTTAKGKAAYEARKAARRADTKRRREERWQRLNAYRALDSFGTYSGPLAGGVPRASELRKLA